MLAGKSLVIIGGTGGLGLSAAAACVAAGARVVVCGREATTLQSAQDRLGDAAAAMVGDARDPDTAARAIDLAIERFGTFEGLYHVAGGSGRRFGDGPLHEMTDEGWRATLDLNLSSMAWSNRAAVRKLLELKRPGAILNMGSVLGFSPSASGFFSTHAYAAAKSAAVGLTRAAAAEYAGHGIRFNLIAPGLVDTPMARRAASDEQILRFIHTKQPLDGGRIGRCEDLDAAVVLLLSDAGRFITGQVLAVDGGWCVSEGQRP